MVASGRARDFTCYDKFVKVVSDVNGTGDNLSSASIGRAPSPRTRKPFPRLVDLHKDQGTTSVTPHFGSGPDRTLITIQKQSLS
jgi:hypothetical protein